MDNESRYLNDTAAFCEPQYVRLLVYFAAREGADVDQLMSGSGLTWNELDQRERPIDLDCVCHVVRACQRTVGRPTLALEAGLQVDTAAHGVLSTLLACSENLRQAVHALQKFLSVRTRTFRIELERARGGLLLKILSCCESLDVNAFLLDYMAAVSSRLIRIVAGPAMQQVRLELPWAEPGWSAYYAQLAGSLKFRAPQMAFWLPDTVLDAKNPTASASNFKLAWGNGELQLSDITAEVTVKHKIVALLEIANENHWPSAEEVASRLTISRRTLINHLKREGTTFRALADAARRDRAMWHLRYTEASVADIALLLGYKDASNFSRVFRRWYGQAPHSVRKGAGPNRETPAPVPAHPPVSHQAIRTAIGTDPQPGQVSAPGER